MLRPRERSDSAGVCLPASGVYMHRLCSMDAANDSRIYFTVPYTGLWRGLLSHSTSEGTCLLLDAGFMP